MKTQMDYVVRRAQKKDLENLVSFTVAEAREAEGIEIDPLIVRRGVEAGLLNQDIAMYWVVESDRGEVVASTSVVKEWSDWKAQYYWWIQSLSVMPDQRGRGLTELLLETVTAEARVSDAADLRLYAHEKNNRAIQAYRRCGFCDSPYRIMIKKFKDSE